MPSYERLSARQHHLLKALAHNAAHQSSAVELDQRTLGSLFWRGLIKLSEDLAFAVSAQGYRALDDYKDARIWRENSKAPMSHYITRQIRRRAAKRSTKVRVIRRAS